MDAFLAEYKALLESNENGWLFEYYPQKDQAYGGYNYILQFKDGYVTALLPAHRRPVRGGHYRH